MNDLKPLKRDKNMYKGSATESDVYTGHKINDMDSQYIENNDTIN